MEAETRRILDIIDEALDKRSESSRELATIFSALRGPDYEGDPHAIRSYTRQAKEQPKAATMVVRMQAFPKACRNQYDTVNLHNHRFSWGTLGEVPDTLDDRTLREGKNHFHDHVILALEVLGWTLGVDMVWRRS